MCVRVWAVTFEAAIEKQKRPLLHSSLSSFEFDLSCIIYWNNLTLWFIDHIFYFHFATGTQANGFSVDCKLFNQTFLFCLFIFGGV